MFFFPDLGSRIPNPYFWELSDNILGKKFYNYLKIGPNFFLRHFINKIFNNFVEFVATNKRFDKKIFPPLSLVTVFVSGMGKNQDPGSGSATLPLTHVWTGCSRLLPTRRGGTCPTTRRQRWTSIWTSWSSERTGSCSSAHQPSTGGQFRAFHLKIIPISHNFNFLKFITVYLNGQKNACRDHFCLFASF